jgi:hypothetical protein
MKWAQKKARPLVVHVVIVSCAPYARRMGRRFEIEGNGKAVGRSKATDRQIAS